MKFVDVCCGGGGASLGATSAGFEVVLGVDVDVAALRVFKANFPLAKTTNLELPCDRKALKALFPAEPYHIHICALLSEWSPTAREDLTLLKFGLDVALHSTAASWSIECSGEAAAGLLEELKALRKPLDYVELDYADLGVPSHRVRLVAGSPSLIAALRHASRYEKRYCSVADVFARHKQQPRGTLVRSGSVAASAPTGTKRRNCKVVDERANALTTRLCLSWGIPPRDPGDEFALRPFTIEEGVLVAGLPPSFKLGEKRAVARRLVGSATPPALLKTMLEHYSRRVAIEGDDGGGDGGDDSLDASPPRKKPRLDNQATLEKFLRCAPATGCL